MEMLAVILLALLLAGVLAQIETQIPSTNQPLLENLRLLAFAAVLTPMVISIIFISAANSQSIVPPLLVFVAALLIFPALPILKNSRKRVTHGGVQ